MARISHRLDEGAVKRLLSSPSRGVARDMFRRGKRVERVAKKLVRVRTGRLRSSIGTELVRYRGYPSARIGTNVNYALYQHEGTGLYGPRRRVIRPKRARVLRWRVNGRYVYARYVRGFPGNHYLERALPAAAG